jgi:hypothetical protein
MAKLPASHPTDSTMRELAKQVFDVFYIPDPEIIDLVDSELPGLSEPFTSIALTFRTNLDSAMKAASIPYTMATATALQRRFDSILAAERIRQLKKVQSPGQIGPEHEQDALQISIDKMKEFQESPDSTIFLEIQL